MDFNQVFDLINIGVVILDMDLKVVYWNRWMEIHGGIKAKEIVGISLLEFFPDLNNRRFLKNFKAVVTFGNISFFSQKLHRYLFPFNTSTSFYTGYEYMQQSCTMGPMRDKDNDSIEGVYVTVQDVTDLACYEKKLLEANMRDGLTGAFNRKYLNTTIEREFERHKRYSRSLCFFMMDIDFFKRINDNYGHQFGDFVLKEFSARIRDTLRDADIFGRYGGEEFCCLLPEMDIKFAANVAERLRHVVASEKFSNEDSSVVVTMSIGVSVICKSVCTSESLIRRADEALYKAKVAGRNRVVIMDSGNTQTNSPKAEGLRLKVNA